MCQKKEVRIEVENQIEFMVDNDKFYIAASKNDTDVIEEFLKKGFDINKKDEFGQSALHIATKKIMQKQ